MPRGSNTTATMKQGAVTIPVCADKKAYMTCMKRAVQNRDAGQIASCRNFCAPKPASK
jgi:hypothetical protein